MAGTRCWPASGTAGLHRRAASCRVVASRRGPTDTDVTDAAAAAAAGADDTVRGGMRRRRQWCRRRRASNSARNKSATAAAVALRLRAVPPGTCSST